MRNKNMYKNPYATNCKLFAHMKHVENALTSSPMVPVCVELHPTNKCNQNCSWCISQQYRSQRPCLHMNAKTIHKFLHAFRKQGGKAILWSGGGDPLQYYCESSKAEFYNLACSAQKLSLQQALYTNGNVLENQLINHIVNSFEFIRVSLDALCAETYRNIRRSEQYEQVIKNLQLLIEKRNSIKSHTTIGVSFLICRENINDLTLLEKWIPDIPVDYLYFKPVMNTKNYSVESSLFEKAVEIIEAYRARYSGPTKLIIPYNKLSTLEKYTGKKTYDRCYYQYFCPCIGPDGYVYTCCHMAGDVRFRLFHIDQWIENSITVNGFIDYKLMDNCLCNCRADPINQSIQELSLALQTPHINYL